MIRNPIIKFIVIALLTIAGSQVYAQPSPPCGDTYGTTANRTAIEDAMYNGTIQDCIDAINTARETRGNRVGCRSDTWSYTTPNITRPTLAQLEGLWNNVHSPGLAAYTDSCAQLGREWPAAALGGLYAQLAGYSAPAAIIQTIADQTEGSQYSELYAPTPLVTYPGVYGYSKELTNSSSPCYRPGVVANSINQWCSTVPAFCPTYNGGLWSGIQFLVVDFSLNPRAYDGGLAYDHGWSAALMLEASLQETNPGKAAVYAASAMLAADWSGAEPAVRNHNYTAKNIWVLAQQYALTGDATYKALLVDRLERNLKPGVLMDANGDGLVDGMTNQPFSGLTQSAQLPGRMWDGHNANMWYHSMNTWAAVEAYVAFRDQGDTTEAADLRPYVIAMLDNLAWELINLGPPGPQGEHMWPIPYSLLDGLWKIAGYENETHANWEDAAATLYNWGLFNTFSDVAGRATSSLGLYLLHETNTPFIPLHIRAGGGGNPPGQATNPTPSNSVVDIGVDDDLSWAPGMDSDSSDIYFGTSNPPAFVQNLVGSTYDPGTLLNDTTYYWRVDEVNQFGTTTGTVWTFSTVVSVGGGSWVELTYDDFESGFGNYTDGGSDCALLSNANFAHQGVNSANIQDNSGVASSFFLTNGIDVASPGYDEIKIEFWFTALSMENNEDFWLQYYDGSAWQTIETYTRGDGSSAYSFSNGPFYFVEETISESNYVFPSNMLIRFMCDASSNGDDIAIDEVRVSARIIGGGGGTPPGASSNPSPVDNSTDVGINNGLSWTSGTNADSSNVYFGTANPPLFVQNQTGTSYNPGTLVNSITYYWRIDEVNTFGTTTGTVWSFTTEAVPAGPETLLSDDFESGSFATEGWTTDWVYTSEVAVSGTSAVKCTNSKNDLISRNLDTSGRSMLTVSFYYYDDDIDNSDNVMFQLWNGSSYDNFVELGVTSPEDTWNFYTITLNNSGSDAQYFRSDLTLKFEGTSIDWGENLGIDDVTVDVE